MTTTTYRNDITGYVVTLIDNERGHAVVTDSKGYSFPMVGADYPHAATLARGRAHLNGAAEVPQVGAPAPIVSPLASEAQVPASNLATGATLTMPTLPQARCLAWASRTTLAGSGTVLRGNASVTGQTATFDQLRAMARRGWLDLNHPVRVNLGVITPAGRAALAAYVAKHGEVL
jgi:hypothetical protein